MLDSSLILFSGAMSQTTLFSFPGAIFFVGATTTNIPVFTRFTYAT
jgi:hypothetical protein